MDANTAYRLRGLTFIWDHYLRPGQVFQDMNGIWHVGEGTDVHALLFEINLTAADKKWLEGMKVKP